MTLSNQCFNFYFFLTFAKRIAEFYSEKLQGLFMTFSGTNIREIEIYLIWFNSFLPPTGNANRRKFSAGSGPRVLSAFRHIRRKQELVSRRQY